MACPRSIEGSAGSRIRLILGDTGSEWLLIIDEDDGNRKWQSHYWSGIPNKVAKQCNNCSEKGRYVKNIDFGPTGAWYINGVKPDGSGGHSWWGGTDQTGEIGKFADKPHKLQAAFGSNYHGEETCVLISGSNGYLCSGDVDDELTERIDRIRDRKKEIHCVRLFSGGDYYISDEEGTEWKGMGDPCSKELKKHGRVEEFAYAGDAHWVVLREDYYVESTGIDDDLGKHLSRFYREQKERTRRRSQEIIDFQTREREERERRAREAHERTEREERERLERERAQERSHREEKEIREREEREQEERAAREEEERSTSTAVMRLLDEVESIEEQEERLKQRKRSLVESIEEIPRSHRARFGLESSVTKDRNENECVVCQDQNAHFAVIPCGHVCLCETCSNTLNGIPQESRLCPLCRGTLQSTLKVYW